MARGHTEKVCGQRHAYRRVCAPGVAARISAAKTLCDRGRFRDDPDPLVAAILYLEASRGQ